MSAGQSRSPWGPRLDRLLTGLMRLGGRLLGRPDEALLHELTGRSKGGPEGTTRGLGYAQALDRGRRLIETGQYGEALFHFREAASLRPDEAWPWHGRGDALQLTGDFQAALAAYEAAIERAPALALSHNGRGNALRGLGRLAEARAAFERALELEPELSWAKEALEALDG